MAEKLKFYEIFSELYNSSIFFFRCLMHALLHAKFVVIITS